MSRRSVVAGIGSALPKRRVTNDELAKTLDTSDEWIVERTGISSRYIASDGETTGSLATQAARSALDNAGIDARDIDLIVLATATPDQTFPSTATKVQAALGINDCIAFDVQAVCTGFLYALTVADSMLRSGNAKKALVIGAETFSRILDWEDRATCVLFGDGAGALVLSAEETESGILSTKLHADGRHNDLLFVDGGPSTTGTVGKLRMKGREVFRHAVVNLAEGAQRSARERRTDLRGRRLGRSAPGQCANPRCNREKTRTSIRKSRGYRRPPRQHVGGIGSASARHGGQGWAHQARRSDRAGSDGRWIYMGCGSAQVLKSLEYPWIRRIADKTDFRYESVIQTGGGTPFEGGRRLKWRISAWRGSPTKRTLQIH